MWTSGITDRSNNFLSDRYGRVRKSGQSFVKFNEGFAISRFSNQRTIGPDFPEKKAAGVYRIGLVGDSHVEGFQLFDRHHFRSILESRLNDGKDSTSFEVLNFGRSGFSLPEFLMYSELYVSQFEPDLVFVFIHPNDFNNPSSDPLLPRMTVKNDSLGFDLQPIQAKLEASRLIQSILDASTVANVLNSLLKRTKAKGIVATFFPELLPTKEEPSILHNTHKSVELTTEHHQILNALNEKNVVFVLCSELPDVTLTAWMNDHQARFISLEPDFEQARKDDFDPCFWESTGKIGHWNHEFHTLIAKHLERWLQNSR